MEMTATLVQVIRLLEALLTTDRHICPLCMFASVFVILCVCMCSSLCWRPPGCSSIDFHFGWYRMSVYQSIEYLPALYLWHAGWSVAARFFFFSEEVRRETSVCVCVCVRARREEERTEERGRNQYIFTESPCVAGTETGRKAGGQRKEAKGFRVRKEARKG